MVIFTNIKYCREGLSRKVCFNDQNATFNQHTKRRDYTGDQVNFKLLKTYLYKFHFVMEE